VLTGRAAGVPAMTLPPSRSVDPFVDDRVVAVPLLGHVTAHAGLLRVGACRLVQVEVRRLPLLFVPARVGSCDPLASPGEASSRSRMPASRRRTARASAT